MQIVLMNDCHLQKSFMLYGEGANGKSVFLNIIEQVFNKNNVSYLQLDGLGDKFQQHKSSGECSCVLPVGNSKVQF